MADSIPTRTTTRLLERLHDASDHEIWEQFDRRYRPILTSVLTRMGMTHDQAVELGQETLVEFVRQYRKGRYDRDKGRLSHWLLGIARHRAAKHWTRRERRREVRAETRLADEIGVDQLEAVWEQECRTHVLELAMEWLRTRTSFQARTIEAFRRTALEAEPIPVVARELGLTPAQVHGARHDCTRRLREFVRELTTAYEVFSGPVPSR